MEEGTLSSGPSGERFAQSTKVRAPALPLRSRGCAPASTAHALSMEAGTQGENAGAGGEWPLLRASCPWGGGEEVGGGRRMGSGWEMGH